MENSKTGDILQVKNLKKYFTISKGLFKKEVGVLKAVDDISFSIKPGSTVSLVGESGCGKTTAARCIMRVLNSSGGIINFDSNKSGLVDLNSLSSRELRKFRDEFQMIFQDPFSSLNPRMTVFNIIAEPLKCQGITNNSELHDRVGELLRRVELPKEFMSRYPHAFSGGQRQRICIARALITDPQFIVADEAVSALDVSVQAQVLNLLMELKNSMGLSYFFVSHDLNVVYTISDIVLIMYMGKIVESGTTEQVFKDTKHPYTKLLLSSLPRERPGDIVVREPVIGEIPDLLNLPKGCKFQNRCPYKISECELEEPQLLDVSSTSEQEESHKVRCYLFN